LLAARGARIIPSGETKVAPKQFGAKQSKVAPEAPNKEKWRLWRLWRQIKERPFL